MYNNNDTVDSRCLELGWVKFLSKSRTSLCINIYNLTPVESNSDESKFWLSRIKVLVTRCRKPYYLHSLSQIYLSKHVYYLGIKIGSQVKHNYIYLYTTKFGTSIKIWLNRVRDNESQLYHYYYTWAIDNIEFILYHSGRIYFLLLQVFHQMILNRDWK
jgi:hypothetical protein